MLWVGRHSPTSQENDEARNEVSLWSTILSSAKPEASQASTPPDNTHSSVLDIVCNPWSTPSVLCEGVDTTECCDHERVKELLRTACSFQPVLSYEHDDRHDDAIANEDAAHDEMSEALA